MGDIAICERFALLTFMTKEVRLIIRLIALWIVFLTSLSLIVWSVQNLALSVVKNNFGGYENYNFLGAGYNTYCIIQVTYPTFSNGMAPLSPEDKVLSDKYSKDLENYNNEVAVACKADLAKQEKSQENQEKSASVGDITMYSVASLIAIFSALISLIVIKKSEEA